MLSEDELALLDAIRETGSLSRAAARLGKAPSTVSHAARQLESRFDALLFDRRGAVVPLGLNFWYNTTSPSASTLMESLTTSGVFALNVFQSNTLPGAWTFDPTTSPTDGATETLTENTPASGNVIAYLQRSGYARNVDNYDFRDGSGALPFRMLGNGTLIVNPTVVGPIATTSLNNGGVLYAVGDTGSFLINSPGQGATYIVTSVSAGGVVTGYTLTANGTGYATGTVGTVDGGAQPGVGSGFTINVLTISGGTAPVGVTSNEFEAVNIAGGGTQCVEANNAGLLSGTGSACGSASTPLASLSLYNPSSEASNLALSGANAINWVAFTIPAQGLTVTHIGFNVNTQDANTGHHYDIGIYNSAGSLVCDLGAHAGGSGWVNTQFANDVAIAQTSVTLPGGTYFAAWTGDATTLVLSAPNNSGVFSLSLYGLGPSNTSTTGQLPSTVTVPAPTVTSNDVNTYLGFTVTLH